MSTFNSTINDHQQFNPRSGRYQGKKHVTAQLPVLTSIGGARLALQHLVEAQPNNPPTRNPVMALLAVRRVSVSGWAIGQSFYAWWHSLDEGNKARLLIDEDAARFLSRVQNEFSHASTWEQGLERCKRAFLL